MKWKRIRPGLYTVEDTEDEVIVERGAETGWWYFTVYRSKDFVGEHGRAERLKYAKARTEELLRP